MDQLPLSTSLDCYSAFLLSSVYPPVMGYCPCVAFVLYSFDVYCHHQVLKFLQCGNHCDHLVSLFVWSHVYAGISVSDVLSLCYLCVTI
jgi:hypothetical protein